jgi:threonine dehydratase
MHYSPAMTSGDSSFETARTFLARHFPPTRVVRSDRLSAETGADVLLKLECELPTGSFKVRGAMYALFVNLRRGTVQEVVASSTGNHGAAVAYASHQFGVAATIFVPKNPNPVKRALIRSFGARVIEEGRDLAAAFEAARAYAAQQRALFLNDADDPDIPAGAGTIGLELAGQVPHLDAVFVPIGDSALIRGVAGGIKGKRRVAVAGVQAEAAPSYYLSWKARCVVTTDTCDTIAEGLATRTPVPANVDAILDLVDTMHLVSDADMLEAMARLEADGVRAEPSGAAALAAILKDRDAVKGKTVVAIVTGANRRD